MIAETLQEIGLDKKEIKVYLASLELGESPALAISKKSKLARELTYVVLKRLEQKGIVNSVIRDHKKYFSVIDPEELIKQLDEKKYLLEKALPELNDIKHKKETQAPEVKTFQGVDGIKTILYTILTHFERNRNQKTLLGYGPSGKFEELLKWSLPHFIESRKKLKVNFKAVYNKTPESRDKRKLPLSEIKFIDKELSSPSFHLIYEDHVAIIIFHEEPLGLIISSKEVCESYKSYFNVLWKVGKK